MAFSTTCSSMPWLEARPARPVPGRHLRGPPAPLLSTGTIQPAEASRQELAGLARRLPGPAPRRRGHLGRYYAEAVRVSLECWMDRWWCVLDPMTWLADPKVEAPEDGRPACTPGDRTKQKRPAAASSWIRERWAQRYNLDVARPHPSVVCVPCSDRDDSSARSASVPPTESMPSFALYNKSGFERPCSRPQASTGEASVSQRPATALSPGRAASILGARGARH